MKKVLLFAAIATVVSLSSCKKDYTCTYGGTKYDYCLKCGKTASDLAESACKAIDGTYAKK